MEKYIAKKLDLHKSSVQVKTKHRLLSRKINLVKSKTFLNALCGKLGIYKVEIVEDPTKYYIGLGGTTKY